MNGWAIAVLVVSGIRMGISLCEHGKTQTKTHNFFFEFGVSILWLTVLYFGGLFR